MLVFVFIPAARLSLRSACSLPHGSRTPARGGYPRLREIPMSAALVNRQTKKAPPVRDRKGWNVKRLPNLFLADYINEFSRRISGSRARRTIQARHMAQGLSRPFAQARRFGRGGNTETRQASSRFRFSCRAVLQTLEHIRDCSRTGNRQGIGRELHIRS